MKIASMSEAGLFKYCREKRIYPDQAKERNTEVAELTAPLLRELVDKIAIHRSEIQNGQRKQEVDIYYDELVSNTPLMWRCSPQSLYHLRTKRFN